MTRIMFLVFLVGFGISCKRTKEKPEEQKFASINVAARGSKNSYQKSLNSPIYDRLDYQAETTSFNGNRAAFIETILRNDSTQTYEVSVSDVHSAQVQRDASQVHLSSNIPFGPYSMNLTLFTSYPSTGSSISLGNGLRKLKRSGVP